MMEVETGRGYSRSAERSATSGREVSEEMIDGEPIRALATRVSEFETDGLHAASYTAE
jgi:hypothetical protein